MTPQDFKAWRKSLGLTQAKTAEALGLSTRAVELYERGIRSDNGQPVEIPRAIQLAMSALAQGFGPWKRPEA